MKYILLLIFSSLFLNCADELSNYQGYETDFRNKSYSEIGLEYALSTKAELGKNLMGKIQKEGTLAALKFCNLKAYPLTGSMSVVHNATIKRVSDKPRNPKNTANSKEKAYIKIFEADVMANTESDPIVVEAKEKVKFYYPIKTNSMCLQCHGNPSSEIKPITLKEINPYSLQSLPLKSYRLLLLLWYPDQKFLPHLLCTRTHSLVPE